MSSTRRKPKATFAISAVVALTAIAAMLVTGRIIVPALALALVVFALWQTAQAHLKPESVGDVDRLNAMKYTDERDRAMARLSFSLVGGAALVLSAASALVCLIAFPELSAFALYQLLALLIIWVASNQYASTRI